MAVQDSPFAARLRQAIAEEGMTLSAVTEQLERRGAAVSLATLSYWRKGARVPESTRGIEAVIQLEEILGLAPNTLLDELPTSTRRPPKRAPQLVGEIQEIGPAVDRALRLLNIPPLQHSKVVSLQEDVLIGPSGTQTRSTVRAVMQGLEGVVDRLAFIRTFGDDESVDLEMMHGGRTGAQHIDSDHAFSVTTIELDTPLSVGGTAFVQFTVTYGPQSNREFQHRFGSIFAMREVLSRFEFDELAVPDWIEEVDEREDATKLTFRNLDDSRSLFIVRSRFGPGHIGIRWGYDRDI